MQGGGARAGGPREGEELLLRAVRLCLLQEELPHQARRQGAQQGEELQVRAFVVKSS